MLAVRSCECQQTRLGFGMILYVVAGFWTYCHRYLTKILSRIWKFLGKDPDYWVKNGCKIRVLTPHEKKIGLTSGLDPDPKNCPKVCNNTIQISHLPFFPAEPSCSIQPKCDNRGTNFPTDGFGVYIGGGMF